MQGNKQLGAAAVAMSDMKLGRYGDIRGVGKKKSRLMSPRVGVADKEWRRNS